MGPSGKSSLRALTDPFASAIEHSGTVEDALVVLQRMLETVRAAATRPNLQSFLGFFADWVSEVRARRGRVGARAHEGVVAVFEALSAASSVRPDAVDVARLHECLTAMRDDA